MKRRIRRRRIRRMGRRRRGRSNPINLIVFYSAAGNFIL